jgi:hypothetical protein
MELDKQVIERIIHDATLSMPHYLEQIREPLSEIESSLGWLVKRARESDKSAASVNA